jgi:hypothetical protein
LGEKGADFAANLALNPIRQRAAEINVISDVSVSLQCPDKPSTACVAITIAIIQQVFLLHLHILGNYILENERKKGGCPSVREAHRMPRRIEFL